MIRSHLVRSIVVLLIPALLCLACGRPALTATTSAPPTADRASVTATPIPPTATAVPPTTTPVPPPATASPTAIVLPTATPVPPIAAPTPAVATPTTAATPLPSGPSVLWRLGGENVFSTLGGLDADGERVYVADAYQGVLVFDLAGGALGVVSPGEIGYVTDVKVGPQGNLYMADAALHQVSMFNPDGELLGGFGGVEGNEFGAGSPAALAVSSEGWVFVLDPILDAGGSEVTRVQVFDADGGWMHSFELGPGHGWGGMDVGPDDTLFVSNQEGYVAEFAPDSGILIQMLGLQALRDTLPQAVAVDDAGAMYVTTQIPAAVAVLDLLGHFVEWAGEETVRTAEGWPEGEFLFPSGVAVSPDGRTLWVGDTFESFAYVTAFSRP